MSTVHGEQLIAGTRSHEGQATFRAYDPATDRPLEPAFHEGTAADVDRALAAAQAAFAAFRGTDGLARAAFLDAIVAALRDDEEAIVARGQAETGLPEGRLRGELGRTTGQLGMFAGLLRDGSWVDARIDLADPARSPAPKPDVRRMLAPIGPVVVFGASNFPLAFSVAGGDTASALAAGCPVVVKGHPAHPGTSELVAEAVTSAARTSGMPDGTFSMLQGSGHEVGLALVRHPATRAVGFTGSLRGGRALYDAAAQRETPIPVFAEMGSSNPVFVLPGALQERGEDIAVGLHGSFTLGVGQFCTNPGLTVVPDGPGADAFRATLAERTRATDPGTMLHSGIQGAYESGIQRFEEVPGVRLLSRAELAGGADAPRGRATVLEVDADRFLERPELAEEVFGPSTLLVGSATREQMHRIAASLDGHLTATLIAAEGELERYRDLVDTLADKVGRLIVNGFPTGVEVGPAMQHGGPYPATTDARFTSVGTAAIFRFVRPIAYQDAPDAILPEALRDANPLGILRQVDGHPTRDAVAPNEAR